MTATCRQCAAPLHLDADARARGVATCRGCATVQRAGANAWREVGVLALPPDGVEAVRRDGVITVDVPAELVRVAPTALVWGAVLGGVGGVLAGVVGGWLVGLLVAGVVAVIATLVAVALGRTPSVVVLDATLLHPAGGADPLPRDDIAQVLVAEDTEDAGRVGVHVTVWVRLRDGTRRPVVALLRDDQIALWLQDILDVELGLYQMPVAGDRARPNLPSPGAVADAARTLPIASSTLPQALHCTGCGLPNEVDGEAQRVGWMACEDCGALCLVFPEDGKQALIGLDGPDEVAVPFERRKPGARVGGWRHGAGASTWRWVAASLLIPMWMVAAAVVGIVVGGTFGWIAGIVVQILFAIVVGYTGMALLLGRWVVELHPDHVARHLHPLPLPGTRQQLDRGDVRGVAVQPGRPPGVRGLLAGEVGEGPTTHVDVVVRTRTGSVPLARGLPAGRGAFRFAARCRQALDIA